MSKKQSKTFITKLLSASAVLAISMSAATFSTPSASYAQEAEPETRQFTAKSGEKVNAANEFMSADNFGAAIGVLNEALAIPDLSSYEKSITYQILGQAYYESGNIQAALDNFQNSINSGGLLPNEVESIELVVAQLLIQAERYSEGATRLEAYLRRGGQEKPVYIELLTQAWVQDANYNRALPWAEKWFRNANPKERKHFDLLNFLYNNLGQTGKQADIVKEMIGRWPEDKTLWDTWASMLANGGREQEAFEVTKMLYLGGALNEEQDLMKVVQYYSFYDMPYQAAQILEREMKAGRISQSTDKLKQLSNLFRQAREYKRAIPILEQAASSSGEAKIYADLGEALYNEGDCADSEKAFREAINRGYNAGKSWMLIATCRYEATQQQDRLSCDMSEAQMAEAPISKTRLSAIEAFENVPSSSRENRDAKKWVSFIKAERGAIDRRCEFERSVEKELCFQKIKQAYDAEVFVGKFELDDAEKCEPFKAEYDATFRIVTVEE
ncbi:MAG: tetratricopeptide repeat protein [Litorimonas sp.]